MNKKFLALSMLMFASWSGSLMNMHEATIPVKGQATMRVNGQESAPFNGQRQSYSAFQPSFADKAYDAAASAGSGLAYAGRALYNAPGQAVKAMGGQQQFITGETGSLASGLSFVDAQAQNAGTRLGIPNLTGRSRDITNIDPKAKEAIEKLVDTSEAKGTQSYYVHDRNIPQEITAAKDPNLQAEYEFDNGVVKQLFWNPWIAENRVVSKNRAGDTIVDINDRKIYTPAPTYINLPARTVRSMYNRLPSLSTSEGRQAFKDSVNAMFKRSGQEAPDQQTWAQFFASLIPDMSLLGFNKSVQSLTKANLASLNSQNEAQPSIVLSEFNDARSETTSEGDWVENLNYSPTNSRPGTPTI